MKMERERLIFVTNDDGYKAKGFKALLDLAREFGRVVAVAPATPQSGRSQAVTMNEPLFLELQHEEEGLKLYSFSGTPVDCVKIAFDHLLLGEKVDLVISGINHGSNAAINVLYSGTMGVPRWDCLLPTTILMPISRPRPIMAERLSVRHLRCMHEVASLFALM